MNLLDETEKTKNLCEPLQKRTVKFSEQDEVHTVVKRRSQFSRKSIAGIWFDGEDFESFMDDMGKCVDKMEQGKRLKDKKYSSLGLEALTEEGSALREAHKEDGWDAVLCEQEYQRECCSDSSLLIAEAYREISRDAEQEAQEMAQKISCEVQGFYSKDDSDLQSLLDRSSSSIQKTSMSEDKEPRKPRRRSSSLPRAHRLSVC